MRHYYLGVEHLFIALLEIKGGLAAGILTDQGFSPEYVVDAIRRKLGKGTQQIVKAGMPNTPRTEVVLALAQEIALETARRSTIHERDLLIAILDEGENVPVRVLIALGLDIDTLRQEARTREAESGINQMYLRFVFAAGVDTELSQDQMFVIRRMFYGYKEVRIETVLTGGYTSSQLLVVTPVKQDGRAEAPVVIKIGSTDVILDEAQRYERYVKGTLPPLTARLEDRPVAPDTCDLAALKYTFLADEEGNPRDMRGSIQGCGCIVTCLKTSVITGGNRPAPIALKPGENTTGYCRPCSRWNYDATKTRTTTAPCCIPASAEIASGSIPMARLSQSKISKCNLSTGRTTASSSVWVRV
jgi:hypothetical protein